MLIRVVTPPCPDCAGTETLVITYKDYENFRTNIMAIQEALPGLTPAQRERLMSGLCGPCFDIVTRGED